MAVFIARRLVISFFVLLAATFVMYTLTAVSGDPMEDLYSIGNADSRERAIAERTETMNLDTPVPLRYLAWLGDLFTGSLGVNRNGQDVSALLGQAVSATLQLVLAAVLLAILFGITVGIVSALRQYTGFDYSITFASFLFFSLPIFWVAVMLKQFAAIEFNNWLRDPTISVPVMAVVSLLSGLAWMAILGGDRKRRLTTFAIAFVATAGLLAYLSATNWFADPGLGFGGVLIGAAAAALGVTLLVSGFRYRGPLIAALASALVGAICYFALGPVLQDPSWGIIVLLAVATVGVGLAIGYFVGGLQRRHAMTTAALTGLISGGLIFLDAMMQAYPGYAERVAGRPISTIGPSTPNFSGDFWETALDSAGHLLLPTMALILISFATYTRYTRASMLEVMNQDYVRTARSKGLTERTVITKHAFRNALIPVTTLMAVDLGAVIGGAVITESVFGWEGMGRLFITGLQEVDPAPVMAFFMVTGTAVVVFNMIADIGYAYLDPRIRLS
ncbi:MAG: ABC transporter permease [Jiangellaceae bacterium]